MLWQGGHGWEDLQLFAAWPICILQLPKLVGLCHILGQTACTEVVNQRPILGHIGHSPHGYGALTGLTKPWPIMQMHATRLSGTVFVVSMVALVTKYHRGQIIVLPTLCTWPVAQWGHGLSKQGRFMPAKGLLQTKGTTGDPVSHTHGLVCWTR